MTSPTGSTPAGAGAASSNAAVVSPLQAAVLLAITEVHHTVRARIGNAWQQTRTVYRHAKGIAVRDANVAMAIAPVTQALAVGPRPATQQTRAVKRATSAQSRATLAAQRAADAAKLAETRAAAAAHPGATPPASVPPAPAPAPTSGSPHTG